LDTRAACAGQQLELLRPPCRYEGIMTDNIYSIWEHRECPECPMCERAMDYIGLTNEPDLNPGWFYEDTDWPDEIWQCPLCGDYDTYDEGNYGETKIEFTAEEWADREAYERQQWYLVKRYGMYNPQRINDYWMTST